MSNTTKQSARGEALPSPPARAPRSPSHPPRPAPPGVATMMTPDDPDPRPIHSLQVDEVLNRIGFGRAHVFLLFIVGLFFSSDAAESMLLSYVGPAVRCSWSDVSPEQSAALTTVVFVGMAVGAIFWGRLADRQGRRFTLRILSLLTFALGAVSAAAPDYTALVLARLAVGVCLGGFGVSFTYFLEFLPQKNRGKFALIIMTAWTAGVLFEAIVAWIALYTAEGPSPSEAPTWRWRWLLGVSAVPVLFAFALFLCCIDESPRWLHVVGRREEAEQVLRRIERRNRNPLAQRWRLAHHASREDMPSFRNVLRILLGKKMRRTTLLLWFIWFANSTCYYGLVLVSTAIEVARERREHQLEAHEEGISSNSSGALPGGELYCHPRTGTPFSETDFEDVFASALSELPALAVAVMLVDRIGRRASQTGAFLLTAGSLFLLLLVPSTRQSDTAFLFFARGAITMAYDVTWLYTPEVLPTAIRTSAFGIANSFSRLGGIVTPFVGQTMLSRDMEEGAELVYLTLAVLAAIASALLPIETADSEMPDELADVGQHGTRHTGRVAPVDMDMDMDMDIELRPTVSVEHGAFTGEPSSEATADELAVI